MAATVGLRSGCRWALGAFGTRTQHFVGKQERCLGQMSKVGVRTRRVGLPMRARSMANQSGASKVRVDLVPCLTDNYSFLIHEPLSGLTAAVDPAEAQPFVDILESEGLNLDFILNTHHHWDHVGGNEELKQKYGAKIVGPLADEDRIPGIDLALKDGDVFQLGEQELIVFDTPGHTRGHIVYYMPGGDSVFVGDTLFALGCGRLFEGTPAQMFDSLAKLKVLPPETKVYCAHEYTQANARFCLSRDMSDDLITRSIQITKDRDAGIPTIPTTIGQELVTNPFLKAESVSEFAEVRRAKDNF
eukprot:CAMPEP_0114242684 /NCGR_PEP_ID=MMETSP0058-20121206/10318_1 /TAXON_ID=36894 /ORGANISM="Pyramimonas parkeae, CCMP726" /LENGTH=301 /DNA_ID=CAMNT_0001355335 /DNA_START=45 /DNA_END=950 /DNA_ORIENTATION=-